MVKIWFFSGMLFVAFTVLSVGHPVSLAFLIISFCLVLSILIFKLSYSWFFFLLVLMYLGGVMVVVMYMTSLAANEKIFFSPPSLGGVFVIAYLMMSFLDENNFLKEGVGSEVVKFLFEENMFFLLMFCFFMLMVSLFSVVKLMKLEQGPLVKRL